MSRTEKDKPYWVLEREGSWRIDVGYPPAISGAHTAISDEVKDYWGAERTKERRAAAYLEQMEPSRHRHRAVWDAA